MLRSASGLARNQAKKLVHPLKIQKRSKGGTGPFNSFENHPPAEHPYLNENNDILYTKWAYTRTTPNSTYADKFEHPMNYQGEVPVTPKSFGELNPDGTYVYYDRMPNFPVIYMSLSVIGAFVSVYFAAEVTKECITRRAGFYFPRQSLPLYQVGYFKNFVSLQGYDRLAPVFEQTFKKNVYQTDEFQLKLNQYISKRSYLVQNLQFQPHHQQTDH